MSKTICPILGENASCLGAWCGMWSEQHGQCSIRVIANQLRTDASELAQMRDDETDTEERYEWDSL